MHIGCLSAMELATPQGALFMDWERIRDIRTHPAPEWLPASERRRLLA